MSQENKYRNEIFIEWIESLLNRSCNHKTEISLLHFNDLQSKYETETNNSITLQKL